MVMLDTNIILRYLLNDDDRMASEAEQIIKNMSVRISIGGHDTRTRGAETWH